MQKAYLPALDIFEDVRKVCSGGKVDDLSTFEFFDNALCLMANTGSKLVHISQEMKQKLTTGSMITREDIFLVLEEYCKVLGGDHHLSTKRLSDVLGIADSNLEIYIVTNDPNVATDIAANCRFANAISSKQASDEIGAIPYQNVNL